MSKRILFSPVGGTDPIKYCRDGSLLHICRHYRPDIVYLYLSKEMLENHRKDNRYVGSIEELGKLINHKFEIVVIERENLVDVHDYNEFYEDFSKEIGKIVNSMQDYDELLYNMASGTPAMKSALLVLATFANYKYLPIQVLTPEKKQNERIEDRKDYDYLLYWECNEDNCEGAENRCTEVECFNLTKLIKINTIQKHIRSFDYHAALEVAKEIKEDISEQAFDVIETAYERSRLNIPAIDKYENSYGEALLPIRSSDQRKIFEYALILQQKVRKEEYVDFIRGITPLVLDLFAETYKKISGIKLSDLIEYNKNGLKWWSEKKLKEKELWDILDKAYEEKGGFRKGTVKSDNFEKLIIYNKNSNPQMNATISEILEIERIARHPAAHEIVSITDDWFLEKTGKSAKGIFDLLKKMFMYAGFSIKTEYWNSYDEMNEKIIEKLGGSLYND